MMNTQHVPFVTRPRRSLFACALLAGASLPTSVAVGCSSEASPSPVQNDAGDAGPPPIVAAPPAALEARPPGEPRRLCPSNRREDGSWLVVEGIDVSDWEYTDWDVVVRRNPNTKFSFGRVSAGASRLDYRFVFDWPGMKRVGLIRGAYQYLRPSQSAIVQADLFLRRLNEEGGLEAEDFPPVLDFETTDDMPTATVLCRARLWLARVERATKRLPIVYASAQYNDMIQTDFRRYPLWVANYVETPSRTCPNTPGAWDQWRLWQWSESGSVEGIYENADHDDEGGGSIRMENGAPALAGSDMNYYDGTLDDLRRFIASTVGSATFPDPTPPADLPEVDGDCSDGCCSGTR